VKCSSVSCVFTGTAICLELWLSGQTPLPKTRNADHQNPPLLTQPGYEGSPKDKPSSCFGSASQVYSREKLRGLVSSRIPELQKEADVGDSSAEYLLGAAYQNGFGVASELRSSCRMVSHSSGTRFRSGAKQLRLCLRDRNGRAAGLRASR
jgi:hypothetical protein